MGFATYARCYAELLATGQCLVSTAAGERLHERLQDGEEPALEQLLNERAPNLVASAEELRSAVIFDPPID